jgi:hypothetical protein
VHFPICALATWSACAARNGNGWNLDAKRVLAVGAGSAWRRSSPRSRPWATRARGRGHRGRNAGEIIFEKRARRVLDVRVTTDDGATA